MPANNKIVMGGPGVADEKEGAASESVTPGHLVDYDGDPEAFVKHATAAAKTLPMVATKAEWSGDVTGDGAPIADDYAVGEHMYVSLLNTGNRAYMFVFDGANAGGTGADTSANANIAVGDKLVSYGDGTLRKFASGTDAEGAALFVAREAVDNSGGTSPARIIVEAL